MKKLLSLAAAAGLLGLAVATSGVATAAPGYTLFGDAVIVTPGNASGHAVQASWSSSGAPYGGVNFAVPAGLTVNQVINLATDYKFTVGSCGGGAPRFENWNRVREHLAVPRPPAELHGLPAECLDEQWQLGNPGQSRRCVAVGRHLL